MSDATVPSPAVVPPPPAQSAAEAAYAADFAPVPPAAIGTADAALPAAAAKPKRRVTGRIVAIIGGGVLAVALVFGGGMWAGWAIGQAQATTVQTGEFPGDGQGGPGGFGQGGSGGEQGTVPNRQGGQSGSSDGSDANS